MKIATSLTLMAIGAILAFAVTSHPGFLNLQVAGLVIMATGVAGILLPRGKFGWLRRRVVVRRGRRGPVVGHVDEERYPSYVMLNPAALDAVQPQEPGLASDELDEVDQGAPPPEQEEIPEWEIRRRDAHNPHGSEMIADVYEE
jgi:hypothetical protein